MEVHVGVGAKRRYGKVDMVKTMTRACLYVAVVPVWKISRSGRLRGGGATGGWPRGFGGWVGGRWEGIFPSMTSATGRSLRRLLAHSITAHWGARPRTYYNTHVHTYTQTHTHTSFSILVLFCNFTPRWRWCWGSRARKIV